MATPRDSGDFGRRVAARRRQLSLSVQDLAERSGMAAGYLTYLEADPAANPDLGVRARLAAALETTVGQLLGGGLTRPPGSGSPPGRAPRLEALDEAECHHRLAGGGIGRVAFISERGPTVLPVNFRLLDGEVVFRTGTGQLARAADAAVQVGFEVDHLDEVLGEGWSVLVTGRARCVTDPDEQTAVEQLGIRAWSGGDRHTYVRVSTAEITGRRIRLER